jgi:hypothetical protein
MLFFPILILLVISYSFIELKMQERICYKQCYFSDESFIAQILSSRLMVSIFYLFISMAMSISVSYGVIDYAPELWFYLAGHILCVIFIYRYLLFLFKNIIKDKYLTIFAREWTVNITTFLLIVSFIYLTVYEGYIPDYLHENLQETLSNASSTLSSHCQLSAYILKVKIEIDSLFWWGVSQNAEQFNSQSIKVGIWLGFIFINSLALLGLNRFIVQVVCFIDKIFMNVENENDKI